MVRLTNLTELALGGNNISDISPVAGLTRLTSLHLPGNNISDVSAVSGLIHLTYLNLAGTNITNLSFLSGLTNLTELLFQNNSISDLSPLVANTGLGSGDKVNVQRNPLSYLSIYTHIPALQNRGVVVEFDDVDIGEPRTVRMIYLLPNDRPYRADVVQRMKDEIRKVQIFFAEQMGAHGYGNKTFRIETDSQGEPMVHRLAGQYPDNHYVNKDLSESSYLDPVESKVLDEIAQTFNIRANIYVIFIDTDIGKGRGGAGQRLGNGGSVLIFPPINEGPTWGVVAHELGHAFGLLHDFRDGSFLMSYGPGSQDQLAMCHADFLAAHPYFNPDTPIMDLSAPTIKLISPRTYPADAKSIPIRLQVSDSEGLHQAILYTAPYNGPTLLTNDSSVTACFGLGGKKETVIDFDYDGIVPFAHNPSYSSSNSFVHPIHVDVVDTSGNMTQVDFLLFSEALESLMKISGDNQTGLPNTLLPVPFVVEIWDVNSGRPRRDISVMFTVIAGGGTLSVTHTMTDDKGRAESTLTLGANLEANIVSVSAAGIEGTVTFTAVAGAAVDIPDPYLRTAIEAAFDKAPGTPIAPSEMATLIRLEAPNANITNLTGLEFATNLTRLELGPERVGNEWRNSNAVEDLSPLADLTRLTHLHFPNNNISNISAVAGLTNLTELNLGGNNLSNIPALAGLTNLRQLWLWENNISDISPVAGLTNLKELILQGNAITDISPVAGLTNLTGLWLGYNNISNISPLVANTGLGSGDEIDVRGNPLSYQSIHKHIPALQSRGVAVLFSDLKPIISEYTLSIPAGINLIHVPLKVTAVDGVAQTVESVSDLYDALGGASTVNFLITYDSSTQAWRSYFVPSDKEGPADRRLTDDTGIIVGLRDPVSVHLRGDALGTNGSGTITLNQGLNVVGLPLNDSRIMRVSDLFDLNGIGGNVPVIILTDGGEFKLVGRPGDPGDIEITGGQAFIMTASQAAMVEIAGNAWTNGSGVVPR